MGKRHPQPGCQGVIISIRVSNVTAGRAADQRAKNCSWRKSLLTSGTWLATWNPDWAEGQHHSLVKKPGVLMSSDQSWNLMIKPWLSKSEARQTSVWKLRKKTKKGHYTWPESAQKHAWFPPSVIRSQVKSFLPAMFLQDQVIQFCNKLMSGYNLCPILNLDALYLQCEETS